MWFRSCLNCFTFHEKRVNFKCSSIIKGFNHMHMNDQMCCESWSRMLDEASKERQWGGGKEPGGRGEVKKPWKVSHEEAASNRNAAIVARMLLLAPEVESRTHLICYYNMASVDAFSHHYTTGTLIIGRLGPYTDATTYCGVSDSSFGLCSQEIHPSLWSLPDHWIYKLSLLYLNFYTKCSYQNAHILQPYFWLWDL